MKINTIQINQNLAKELIFNLKLSKIKNTQKFSFRDKLNATTTKLAL